MNALAQTQGGAVATLDEYDPYAEYGNEVGSPIVGKLIKFSKGDYLVDKTFIEEGTEVIANMPSILRGWIKWVDNKPAEQIMGLLKDGHKPQARSTLGDTDEREWEVDKDNKPQDPWKETNYIVLKSTTDDQLYTFSTASVGGRGAFKKLCEAYATGRRMHPNQAPIIALNVGRYEHKDKTLGWIKFPEFKIVGWTEASFEEGADETKAETKRIQNMANEKAADDLLNRVGRGEASPSTSSSGAPRF